MLTIAWIFMAVAILATGVLLGDLRHEIEYNKKNRSIEPVLIITEGDRHGLQKADYRQDRVVFSRCCF